MSEQEPAVEPVIETVVEEPVVEETVVEEPVVEETVVEEPSAEALAHLEEERINAIPLHPMTHAEIEALDLSQDMKHWLSERLLNRAMHSLLEVAPNGWESVKDVEADAIHQGDNSTLDALFDNMNSQTNNLRYEMHWYNAQQPKPFVFGWIVRQLRFISNHGIAQYKKQCSQLEVPPSLDGLWQLDNVVE
jgi:hypothetical protein